MLGLAASILVLPELGGVSLLGHPALDAALLLLVGCVAGLINVMAGGGSFLLLPVLIGLGLPATVANGTTRLGVITQSATAVATFRRKGVDTSKVSRALTPAMLVGALLGAWLATRIDPDVFEPIIGVVLIAWAIVLLVKPDRFLHPPEHERAPTRTTHVFGLLVGFYGGFLQAGVGFPLIALLSGHLGYDLVRANASKVALTLVFSLATLPIFMSASQVAWAPAIVLAIGTMTGAWLGTRWQLAQGNEFVRRFVLVMVAISGIQMLISTFG